MKRARDASAQPPPQQQPPAAKRVAPPAPPARAAPPAIASCTPAELPQHAFVVTDARDHAETPLVAYQHLEPLLFRLALALGRTKATLRIYDPYYCAGSAARHLASLGFTSVVNRNEDCYAAWAEGRAPEFDVLLTNPPFSADHIPRALAFAVRSGKPWAMLVPEFCARKAYFRPALGLPPLGGGGGGGGGGSGGGGGGGGGGGSGSGAGAAGAGAGAAAAAAAAAAAPLVSPLCGPIHYLGPRTAAYMFSAPNRGLSGAPLASSAGGGSSSSSSSSSSSGGGGAPRVAHLFAATFQCVWFLALGAEHSPGVLAWWAKKAAPTATCAVSSSELALPQLALDPGRKRREEAAPKRSWRKKLSRQRKKAGSGGGSGGGGGEGQ